MGAIASLPARRQTSSDPAALANGNVIEALAVPASLPADLLKQATEHGYGNRFAAVHHGTPWRPQLADDTSGRLRQAD